MKRLKLSRQNVKEWLGSYLVVLLIPIIICSVFFLYTNLTVWEETREANMAALKVISSELDSLLEEALLLEYNIQNDADMKRAAGSKRPVTAAFRYDMMKAKKKLVAYMGTARSISAIYVAYPNNEMVSLSGGGSVSYEEVWNRIGEQYGLSKEVWKELLTYKTDRKFLIDEKMQNIACICSVPRNGNSPLMNIIVEFSPAYIQNIMSYLDYMKNSSIILTDNENEILFSNNLNVDMDSLVKQVHVGDKYSTVYVNGQKTMTCCITTGDGHLKLFSVIPYREFWSKSFQSLFSFFAVLCLCIIIGIVTAYFFSLTKQRTWGKFYKMVIGKLDGSEKGVYARNKGIMQAIDNVIQEYETMQKQSGSMHSMKKELFLTAALRGRIRENEVEQLFENNQIAFAEGNYVVILFRLRQFERFFEFEKEESGEQAIEQIREMVLSVVQPLIAKGFQCEILKLHERIACIVDFCGMEKEECYAEIDVLCGMKPELKEEGITEFQSISISDVHRHAFSLHSAYLEASRVMEYQLLKGGNQILSYREMILEAQSGYLYSLENETTLIRWISSGKKEDALQLFREIYDKNVASSNTSKELSRCLMWNLTATVLRAEEELIGRSNISGSQELLERIMAEPTLVNAKDLLMERIDDICEEAARVKGKKGDLIAGKIMEFIQEHYDNPDLSNREIADYFQMNVSYFSVFFKDKTGMSPLAYIQQIRLEKAKELLLKSNMTVEEISVKTGCGSGVNLNRLFHKYEGVTPASYRVKHKVK